MQFKKMNYEVYHKVFGTKTRGEWRTTYDDTITLESKKNKNITERYRSSNLQILMRYLKNTQYEGMPRWDSSSPSNPIPPEKRAPKIVIPLPDYYCNTIASYMFGEGNFPRISVENNDDLTEKISDTINKFRLEFYLKSAMYYIAATGACFLYVFIANNKPCCKVFTSDTCYPTFDDFGNLTDITIQYVYIDPLDNKPKWYKLELTEEYDQHFNNPEYKSDEQPVFKPKKNGTIQHNLGFVQGVWFCNGEATSQDFDGESLIAKILTLFDDINYQRSSQSSALIRYANPQLVGSGMDGVDFKTLISSPETLWGLGKEGKIEYLQAKLDGVKDSELYLSSTQNFMSQVSDIPNHSQNEHRSRSATSGQAMRLMMEGLINKIKDLRTTLTPQISELIYKTMTLLYGESINDYELNFKWYQVITDTAQDILQKAQASQLLIQNKIISRETILRSIADDFSIEDVDAELKRIDKESEKEANAQAKALGLQQEAEGNSNGELSNDTEE